MNTDYKAVVELLRSQITEEENKYNKALINGSEFWQLKVIKDRIHSLQETIHSLQETIHSIERNKFQME